MGFRIKTLKNTKHLLSFIELSIKRRGHPPTVREIAKKFGFSPAGAHYYIKKLVKAGILKERISNKKRVARGIKFES